MLCRSPRAVLPQRIKRIDPYGCRAVGAAFQRVLACDDSFGGAHQGHGSARFSTQYSQEFGTSSALCNPFGCSGASPYQIVRLALPIYDHRIRWCRG